MRWLCGLAAATLLLAACTDDSSVADGTPKTDATTNVGDTSGLTDDGGGADAEELSSCKGISAGSRKMFSQFDSQCDFLSDCAASGKCHCGASCSSDKTKCSDAICAKVDATCLCGEKCEPKGDQVMCPDHVCTKAGDIKGCKPQNTCKYVDKELDPKCTCTQMPGSKADCWCGSACPGHYAACESQECKSKPADKCIVVPGAPFKSCYCATCGLKGDVPKCFFGVCPTMGNP